MFKDNVIMTCATIVDLIILTNVATLFSHQYVRHLWYVLF